MAIVSKTTRCAVCGSTDVTFSEATKRYHCASCGADEAHAMNAADVAAINSIAALGDTEGKLDELRRRYPNLTSPAGPARTASRCDLTPLSQSKNRRRGAPVLLCLFFRRSTAVTGRRGWRPAGRRSPRRRAGPG